MGDAICVLFAGLIIISTFGLVSIGFLIFKLLF